MSETANDDASCESEKPVPCVKVEADQTKFPPFPDPGPDDFDDDISDEERNFYKDKFKDLNEIKYMRLHCTACDRHLGCSPDAEDRMRTHPMLRTLVCHSCYTFYNSGEFEKGDDGSELYCRWCGQGGQVYCCADCPHVFCAKCIKRNLGAPKIKEIENMDDWKCFKCNFKCLWGLRAICWGVLRYCTLKKKMATCPEDLSQKDESISNLNKDESLCCLNKIRRKEKLDAKKKEAKKEKELEAKTASNIISKIPPTIQVKKFASINLNDEGKLEPKKAQKRSLSPKNKPILIRNPIAIAPLSKVMSPINVPHQAKKIRLPAPTVINNSTIRVLNSEPKKGGSAYPRIRPKPIQNNTFNGYTGNLFNHLSNMNNMTNDNINLSIDSLTQGLDMSAVVAMSQCNSADNDVVCTPDFPLEPLCEVTEDNDDDVECITPGPVAIPKMINPPPLVPRGSITNMNDISPENIIQMTENDVTVNALTGGLKFRVDPQTLSSNKMYRLPDGRIFAINANPNMPGGYSATIVAVAESAGKTTAKGATYAAKLSAVSASPVPKRNQSGRSNNSKRAKTVKTPKPADSSRQCDFTVPVEWYRYNLIDAIDALEYPLARLNKLKKEATTLHLRSRTVDEMRNLHRTLERLLNTSVTRFGEIRENLNKGLRQYLSNKSHNSRASEEEDDDDVEILPGEDDDPIFIDENSLDSNVNGESQEVDLTGAASSEHNDSTESPDKNKCDRLHNISDNVKDNHEDTSINTVSEQIQGKKNDVQDKDKKNDVKNDIESIQLEHKKSKDGVGDNTKKSGEALDIVRENDVGNTNKDLDNNSENDGNNKSVCNKSNIDDNEVNDVLGSIKTPEPMEVTNGEAKEEMVISDKDKTVDSLLEGILNNKADSPDNGDKMQDSEISEEMIESLLKDDSRGGDAATNANIMDVSEVLGET